MENIQNSKKIAKNTIMLYFRQILIMLVSLFTVRVVLNTLGADDYGIYNVVAGIVTMFSFLSGSMAAASQRYFCVAIGENDSVKLKQYFSMSLTIYILIALIIFIFAETFGLYFILKKLVVPDNRYIAAIWVYESSVLSMMFTIITSPFMASIIAHEDMKIYAYVSVIEVIMKLLIVFLLPIFPIDKLIFYSILMFLVTLINTALYRFYCHKKYEECYFKFYWNKNLFKELMSYTGWNLFGSCVGVFKNQIVNVILNQFFTPIVNAARGIASQVNSAINSFASNFMTAVKPQIVKRYAIGEKDSMIQLMFSSSKASFFLMYIFALPLIIEMPYVLKLWLKNTPNYAVIFTILALIDALIDTVSYSLMGVVQATGRIKLYQAVVGSILLLNAPFSYLAMKLGSPAYSVFLIAIFFTLIAGIARLIIVNNLVHFSILRYIRNVILPIMLCIILTFIPPYYIHSVMKIGFLRLVVVVLVSCISITIVGYLIAIDKNEKVIVKKYLKNKLGKNM